MAQRVSENIEASVNKSNLSKLSSILAEAKNNIDQDGRQIMTWTLFDFV